MYTYIKGGKKKNILKHGVSDIWCFRPPVPLAYRPIFNFFFRKKNVNVKEAKKG